MTLVFWWGSHQCQDCKLCSGWTQNHSSPAAWWLCCPTMGAAGRRPCSSYGCQRPWWTRTRPACPQTLESHVTWLNAGSHYTGHDEWCFPAQVSARVAGELRRRRPLSRWRPLSRRRLPPSLSLSLSLSGRLRETLPSSSAATSPGTCISRTAKFHQLLPNTVK